MHKGLLTLLALGSFGFAIYHVVAAQHTEQPGKPVAMPNATPFRVSVVGAGVVEPQTENIAVGSPSPGVVREVRAKVGKQVKQGEVLFRLDDRHLQAEFKTRAANLEAAKAKLLRLMQQPRPEEVPPAEAKVREAQSDVASEEDSLARTRSLHEQRALSDEELNRRIHATQVVKERLKRVQAEMALLKAGAWEPDKLIARAEVIQMEALLEQTRIEIERLEITAPVDGEVLQVNVRRGEFVPAVSSVPLVMLGNVQQLHLRVDIDEHDIYRFEPLRPAYAMVRGQSEVKRNLQFVRVEPFVVPKRSLTGLSSERIDTRVLQVIYALEASPLSLYVGQQMDVFIEAKK